MVVAAVLLTTGFVPLLCYRDCHAAMPLVLIDYCGSCLDSCDSAVHRPGSLELAEKPAKVATFIRA